MRYRPQPIDTSQVILPAELLELTEILARNTHEVWASNRLAEGWRYGPVRDDAAREHPCLIPYEQLPENERDYDRKTALQALRVVIASGFVILPPKTGQSE